MNRPEILAPAGSRESLEAAVRAGADAVYLGGTRFSARGSAENFSDGALRSAVAYCHMRGVKVYLAENILLYEKELPAALEFAKTASDAGVDAYILQDLGLAAILKQASPILLHASTQMTVHSPAGISAAAKLGFSRVVLARELSLDEIAEIAKTAKALGVELEVFVHGALCMSVSGQCYFSAMLGGRSGNRGLCAQPCRLPYNGENSYPLSLKDLCALDRLSELAALGVCSFKIEGRMKRPEYVAAATAAYRTAADGNTVSNEERGRLERVFSRGGFTDGYLTGKRSDMFGRRDERQKQEERQVLSELHELYRKERQSVPVSMRLRVVREESASLTVDDTAHRVMVFTDPPQHAKSRPLSVLAAEERLRKTGDTPYYVTRIECEIGEGLFDPGISELRRRALEELSQLRSKPEIRPFSSDIS
ncbi:MAG TPA: peptidase U32, partial [Ruminococcaceae bacterium]|nr:peptidase U32 [Oscillospiraceae bacterium]